MAKFAPMNFSVERLGDLWCLLVQLLAPLSYSLLAKKSESVSY